MDLMGDDGIASVGHLLGEGSRKRILCALERFIVLSSKLSYVITSVLRVVYFSDLFS